MRGATCRFREAATYEVAPSESVPLTRYTRRRFEALEVDAEPTGVKEFGTTKVVLGPESTDEDAAEARELVEQVWILSPEEIEIVSSDWMLAVVREGKDVSCEAYIV